MTQEKMNILVPQKLREIEAEYGVTVLYAAESGSRAWGFASPDSDFDIRFIYKRPQTEYLHLEQMRDVIEIPIDSTWDISGWDLNKALRLLHNSNPGLYDWIGSPVCYFGDEFKNRIMPLMRFCFSKSRMLYHYQNIAQRHVGDVFNSDRVSPKKYFYAMRAVLSCIWIERKNYAPPVLFSELVETVLPLYLNPSLKYILDRKKNDPERAKIEHVTDIDEFLKEMLEAIRFMIDNLTEERSVGWNDLNTFFLSELYG